MDRRDVLLDQLSQYGQVSVEQLDGGSTNVSFVDGTTGTTYPIVSDKTATWAGPPAGGWNPGGQMGGLLERRQEPGRHDRRLPGHDRLVHQLARHRGQQRLRRHLLHHRRARGRDDRRLGPDPGRAGQHHLRAPAPPAPTTSRWPSRSCAATPAIDGAYKAFVAKVGGDLNEATRMQANAQVLADSVEDRRQSVAGRLDGRGDVQPRALPACLPGLRARHVDDGRDARRPHQPHRKGGSLSHAHHHLHGPAQRPLGPQRAVGAARQDPGKASSGKEITRPVGRSVQDRAGDGPAVDASAPTSSTSRNIQDAQGWRTRPSPRWTRSRSYVNRAHDLLLQGADRHRRRRRRARRSPPRSTRSSRASRRRRTPATATSTSCPARRPRSPPYKLGADDAYQGDQAGLDPAIAGIVREIGPGVTMTINTVAREILGDGRATRPTASC